ncbi:MAG: EVE domain-containing protein, partial [Acidimicrobiia bacterium]
MDPPVTLAEVKQSNEFTNFALVRQSRLSTMAVPGEFIQWLR